MASTMHSKRYCLLLCVWLFSWVHLGSCGEGTLDRNDIRAVRKIWRSIKEIKKKTGSAIFLGLFNKYPTYQKLFSHFADVPTNELENNEGVLVHANAIMTMISNCMDKLDKTSALKALLVTLGRQHISRKVGVQHFQHLKDVFIEVLKTVKGVKVTDKDEKAWKNVLNFIVGFISEGLTSNQPLIFAIDKEES